jgi:hypothetical protein
LERRILKGGQLAAYQWYCLFKKLVNCRNFVVSGGKPEQCGCCGDDRLTTGDALVLVCYIIDGARIPVKSLPVGGLSDIRGNWTRFPRGGFFYMPSYCKGWATVESLTLENVLCGENEAGFFYDLVAHSRGLRRLEIRNPKQIPMVRAAMKSVRTLQELCLVRTSNDARDGLPAQWWKGLDLQGRAGHLRKLHLETLSGVAGVGCVPFFSALREHHGALEEIRIRKLHTKGPGLRWLHFPSIPGDPLVDSGSGSSFRYGCHTECRGLGRELCTYVHYAGLRMDLALQKLEASAEES